MGFCLKGRGVAAGREIREESFVKNARLVAERYAQALAGAVPKAEDLSRAGTDVARLAEVVASSDELARALASPVVAADAKRNVMLALAERLAVGREARALLAVLAPEHWKIFALIAAAVGRAADARAGVVEATVRTAAPLPADVRARLDEALAKLVGAAVRTRTEVDPALLGGVVVEAAGRLYDGSLKARLAELRTRLAGGAAGAIAG